ncbi:peptidylprolyl isomerase [Roseateles sp. SL47]|uniref:peptidylprolyl isomerase n=1 Tax=Roseateles sp. SL47 TaxID=2995138 RepID=UPI00227001D8|nr:peptidylprolyl isomerase [Roseateles sp. SL47]WAC72418.1 peptidylprolyl isomerase [Roseateles sp. SL47]
MSDLPAVPISAPKSTWSPLWTAVTALALTVPVLGISAQAADGANPAGGAHGGASASPGASTSTSTSEPAANPSKPHDPVKAAKAAPAHAPVPAASAATQPQPTSADIIATAPATAWREVDPDSLLIMTLPQGEAYIELAPRFAPRHVDNIRALARGGYWDGLAILRVQDNYVTQWGDPDADDEDTGTKGKARPFPTGAAPHLPAEFDVPLKGLPLNVLPDVDGWAPQAGHVDGFPVAADPKTGRAWMAHCYATVGAGRGNDVDSSTGAELYVVIGHAPRGLDLNITVVGRVLRGMEDLSSLPRGTGRLGFYDKPEQRQTITRITLASALPADQRPQLQVLRTDTPTWQALLHARRHRGGWFVHSPEHTEICSAAAPVRNKPTDVKLEKIVSPESRR